MTDKEIEDKLLDSIYESLSKQDFYDFYMSKSRKSFTAHLEQSDNCPTKEEILKQIKHSFPEVIKQVKEMISCQ